MSNKYRKILNVAASSRAPNEKTQLALGHAQRGTKSSATSVCFDIVSFSELALKEKKEKSKKKMKGKKRTDEEASRTRQNIHTP